MSYLAPFKAARNLFRRLSSPTKAARPRRAQSVILWPDWREKNARWNIHDLTAYIEEGFNLNSIIYSAIMYKVRAALPAVLQAVTGTRKEPKPLPASNELAKLLDRPNKHQSFAQLQMEAYTMFNLLGNTYIWFKKRPGREFPVAFFNLRSDRVVHLYDDKDLKGYAFVPVGMSAADGIPLLAEDVMHVRLPNPGDPFLGLGKGLAPTAPLAQSADVDNSATAFLKLFFDQGTMPMGLLKTDQPLDDDDISEARERWLDAYGNWQQWIEPVMLGLGIEYQRIGANFSELDLEKLDARNTGRIVAPYGVPLTLIVSQPGLVQATYSNKQTDREIVAKDVIVPELMMFEDEWRFFLRNKSGTQFAQYDFEGVPAFINQMVRTEELGAGWDRGAVLRGEYRKALKLPVTDADRVYKLGFTAQLIPAGEMVAPLPTAQAPLQTEAGADSAETETDDDVKALTILVQQKINARKLTLHNEINRVAVRFEDPARGKAQAAFEADKRAIMAIVTGAQKLAYEGKQTVDWGIVELEISAYLAGDSKAQWRSKFDPTLAAMVTAQGTNLSNLFDQPFEAQEFLEQDWFLNYRMTFVDPISATSEREIAVLMQDAAANGWSVPRMQENLTVLFEQWIDGTAVGTMAAMTEEQRERLFFATNRLPPWRSEIIARTEMIRASNATSLNLYSNWGVQEKEWFSTPDPTRTRETHQVGAAFGQEPLVASIGKPFIIGGSPLMFPGDPGGPLSETAQ